MSIFDEKLISTRRLYAVANISKEMGERVINELVVRGEIDPEVTPSRRSFVSPIEAERFQRALVG